MTTSLVHPPKESDSVRSWRFECLLAAGYTCRDARELSEHPDIDLHLAVELLARGCSVETARRILL